MKRIAPALAALFLAAPLSARAEQSFEIKDYVLDNATLISATELQQALQPYIGRGKDFGTIQAAIAALETYYTRKGYGAVKVMVPEQDIEDGRVSLRVLEATVGRVQISGQHFFSEENIRRSLPGLTEGKQPNFKDIDASLRVANENSAKQTNMLFRQGEREGQIDALIKVADETPMRLALTADNSGVPGSDGKYSTGRYRTGFVLQHSNLFDRDHALSFQYMTAPEYESKVTIMGLGYRIPLYESGNAVELAYGYSNVDSGTLTTAGGNFGISGSGHILSAKFDHMLPKWGDWLQKFTYGLDYRVYTNSVKPEGSNESLIPDVIVHPLSLAYSGTAQLEDMLINGSISYAHNIPGGADGTTADFNRPGGRLGATASYRIWRANLGLTRLLPADWLLKLAFSAQYTRDALVSGEQFGAGGADSVRGFYEREFANDKGSRGSVELSTPDLLSLLDIPDLRTRVLVFYDTAQLSRNKAQPGEVSMVSLASYGLGLRGGYSKQFSYRLDWGIVSDPAGNKHVGNRRFHASLVFSF